MHFQRKIELADLLQKVESQKSAELPFVIYSFPNKQEVRALFQKDATMHRTIDFKEKGFVFAPFNREGSTILLKPNTFFTSDYRAQKEVVSKQFSHDEKGKQEHIDLVKKGIGEIDSGNLKKVVLSRSIEVEASNDYLSMFMKALNKYEKAFCYLWFHPKIGIWLGASPEQLLQIQNTKVTTTSLAGTLPYLDGIAPEWGEKEREEQQMVTDFLLEELKDVLENIETSKVTTVKAGKLWHLKTQITAVFKQNERLEELIYRIHPSPAVCGLPKDKAKNFINQFENYDRSFYTGFLGELNFDETNATSLFVNLRCMCLDDNRATIFVGGGITQESNPESEWLETQNKSNTMASLL